MKKYLIIALAAGLALVSCQKEKLIENSEAPANEITLKAATVSTKSAIDGEAFPAGYGMLVSAYRNNETGTTGVVGEDTSADYFEGIRFVMGGSTSSPTKWGGATSPKYWPLNGTLDFLCIASAGIKDAATGVAPSTCTWGDGSNVAKKVVVTVPSNATKFDDILYGSANDQSYVSSGTPIDFKHAECAVVFLAKSNVGYSSTTNVGITITGITVNNPYTAGTFTVSNLAAGKLPGAGALSANWDSVTSPTDIKARVWDSTNTGVNASEPILDKLDLTTTYNDTGANTITPPATTPTALTSKFFGDAYVIVPPQAAVPFTISYTLHNGKDADGNDLNHSYTYKYTPTGNWEMGKKVIYLIDITQHEILITPTVTKWDETFKDAKIGS